MSHQDEYNKYWEKLMIALEKYHAPNPLNPCGLSDSTYDLIMTGFFIPVDCQEPIEGTP